MMGILVDLVFVECMVVLVVWRKLGLLEWLMVLLFLGGFGVGLMVEVLELFCVSCVDILFVVVVGKNVEFERKCCEMVKMLFVLVMVYGFVMNMYELMDLVDLIVIKLGGFMMMEVFVKGKLMVFVFLILG